MQDYLKALAKIKNAATIAEVEAEKEACKAIIAQFKATNLQHAMHPEFHAIFKDYPGMTDEWIIEQYKLKDAAKKERSKGLQHLAEIIAKYRRLELESAQNLINEIRRTKKFSQLQKLKNGYVIRQLKMPSIRRRMHNIANRKSSNNSGSKKPSIGKVNSAYKQQLRYLQQKRNADRLALLFSGIIATGVGFIGGVAILLILPTMPLAAFIATFIAFSLIAGFTEGMVYHSYNKKFCRRLLVSGFFERIEHRVLNERAKEFTKRDRHDLTAAERKAILRTYRHEIRFKKCLAAAVLPLALITGVGFAALVFSHISSFAALASVASGTSIVLTAMTGGIAIPLILSIVIGVSYAIVMYSMLYKAIKNNIINVIRDEVVKLFTVKGFTELTKAQQASHILQGLLKVIGVLVVLGITITATVFTAGAWLNSSSAFFQVAFGLITNITEKIAKGITVVMVGTTFGFNIENSLKTISTFTKVQWRKLAHSIKDTLKHPTKLLSALLNFIPLSIHVAATGAIAVQGAADGPYNLEKIGAGIISAGSEALVDSHVVLEQDENHGHDDHNHDMVGTLWQWIKNAAAKCMPKKETINNKAKFTMQPRKDINNSKDSYITISNNLGTDNNATSIAPASTNPTTNNTVWNLWSNPAEMDCRNSVTDSAPAFKKLPY